MNLLRKLANLATENRATGAAGSDNEAASLSPLKDPATGKHLPARRQPGYYPGFSTLAQEKYWDAATRMLIHRRVNRSIPIRFFTSDEEKTMHAVVDRVLPQEDREYAYRIDVLAGIDERLFENRLEGYRYADMPPDQDAYRLAARAFEAMAHEQYGQSFHALDITRQETLLRSIHHTEPLAAKELWSQMNIKRFWTMLVADCCSVYYAHHMPGTRSGLAARPIHGVICASKRANLSRGRWMNSDMNGLRRITAFPTQKTSRVATPNTRPTTDRQGRIEPPRGSAIWRRFRRA